MALRALKRRNNTARAPRAPVTFKLLCKICHRLRQGLLESFQDILMRTVCTIAFFGFLRCGEFTVSATAFDPAINLCVGDVTFMDDATVVLRLKASKMDPFRHGIDIRLCATGHIVCPYVALREYLAIRGTLGNNRCYKQPLFIESPTTRNPLSRNAFLTLLNTVLVCIGESNTDIKGHSFRIGAATAAAAANVEDHLIKTLGRWNSDCYQRYIRVSTVTVSKAQRAMIISS